MAYTGQMVSTVESDRASRPRIEFRGYRLYGVDVPKCSFPFLFRYVRDIDHIHSFNLGRKLPLASITWPARFIVILAAGALTLFFGCDLAGLFNYPIVTVGMVGGFIRSAVNLAGPV
jgi:hypothetical protein